MAVSTRPVGKGGSGNPPLEFLYTHGAYVSHTHLIESRNPLCEKEPAAAYGPEHPPQVLFLSHLHTQQKGALTAQQS
jgi:hypothetical protein